MNSDEKRSGRINSLYRSARTGKYTWAQLTQMAQATGVTKATAKTYIDAVEARLRKEGLLN
jgi:predicted DNA-binding ribbon-helix-helix protein